MILATIPNAAYIPFYTRGPDFKQFFSPERARRVSETILAMDAFIAAFPYDILDLRCIPVFYEDRTLESGLLWYPNDAGYERMGSEIARIARSQLRATAEAACPPYTVSP